MSLLCNPLRAKGVIKCGYANSRKLSFDKIEYGYVYIFCIVRSLM